MNNIEISIDQISNKLLSFLKEELKDSGIGYDSGLERLTGGYETSIYRFKLSDAPNGLSKSLVLRLYPEHRGADQAVWESTVQNVLYEQGLPVAKVHYVKADKSILGGVFSIMDHLPGILPDADPEDEKPEILGKAHAQLHMVDPVPIARMINEKGTNEYKLSFSRIIDRLKEQAGRLPWIREGLDWLIDNRPPEPKLLSICHRDFHGFNILVVGDKVTGILDLGNFRIADPALDVATTLVLITITGPHLGGETIRMDPEVYAERYLAAYRAHKSLDNTYLEYYQVSWCLGLLVIGFTGVTPAVARPPIVRDLKAYIKKVTGINVSVPA
jgi:aminoglycoside phosphotransferase (APT) family kinase protein